MLRKTIAMIMAIAIVGGTMCTTATVNDKDRLTAVAAEADEIIEPDEEGIVTKDGVKYEVSEKDASIVGYTNDFKGDLVIPEKINGLPVTSISKEAFKDLSTVENIILPDTIEVIDAYAFSGCSSIKSFDMPKNLQVIGDYAFSGMDGLTSVKIPEDVFYIGNGAFSECANLTSADFEGCCFKLLDLLEEDSETNEDVPNNESDLLLLYKDMSNAPYTQDNFWQGIFLYCPKLEKVSCKAENDVKMGRFFFNYGNSEIRKDDTISDDYLVVDYDRPTAGRMDPIVIPKSFKTVSITEGETLSRSIFSNMQTLETISLPDSLKKIDDCAFWDCSNLKSIDIPKNVTEIGVSSFSGCSGLKSIDIPENVTLIGDYAFAGCNNIEELVLPEKLETIGNEAFGGMDSLTSAVLPASVKKVGYELFDYCNNLRSLKLESTPEISAKPDTWPAPDVNVGMVLYCPNLETVETQSNVFTLTNKEGEEKKISSLDAFFGGDYLHIPEGDEDKYKNGNPDYVIPKSLKSMITDIGDSIYGDANLDGTVDISDAVLIMQSLSNPSKYKLSDEAKTAADVSGKSDGVTNADALTIQKYLLKILYALPFPE